MRRLLPIVVGLCAGLLVPAVARAHFILMAPDNWAEQGSLGDPQKSPPCGQADPGVTAVPTGKVTAFGMGQTITITINETVTHPGHYRVALSTTGQAGLPADPPVTQVGADACGMKEIMNPPQYPVLADGMLPHTAAFSGPQSFTVQLPPDVSCNANCVLQVTEYMQNHGAPCFYHHCAGIAILPPDGTGGTTGTGGTGSTGRGGTGGSVTGAGGGDVIDAGGSGSGCGCAVSEARVSVFGLAAMLLIVAIRRRSSRPPGTRTGS